MFVWSPPSAVLSAGAITTAKRIGVSSGTAHAIFGSFVYQHLVAGRPGPDWAERVVDTLWAGFAADGH
jgi:hypothetical protein